MNINKGTYLALILILLTSFGCRDKCKRLDCVNGECVEGVCVCESGYEGGLCESLANEKFDAIYTVEEECTGGSDEYEITMTPNATEPSELKITGIWEKNDTIIGVLDNTGLIIEIERQTLDNVEVTATATSDAFGNTIQLDYQIYNTGAGSPFDNCSASLDKN